MQNFLLGHSDHYPSDEQACDALLRVVPRAARIARTMRAFTERAVRILATENGIRQFLDLGCGLPAARNVHQIAQQAQPGAKVVYIDRDPGVLGAARMVLDQNDNIAVINADITDRGFLSHPDIVRLVNPDEPTAVLLTDVLQCVPDAFDPAGVIRDVTGWQTAGGHIVLSHLVCDDERTGNIIADLMLTHTDGAWGRVRTRRDVHALVHGLPLSPPGLTEVSSWRSDVRAGPRRATRHKVFGYGGIAHTQPPGNRSR
jgi:SAM-dependent methyltransferase